MSADAATPEPSRVKELSQLVDTSYAIAPTSGAGLTIAATFDPSVTPTVQTAINAAISVLQARFKDPITVQIYFRYTNTQLDGVTPLGTNTLAQSNFVIYNIPWNTFISALTADAKTTNDSTANSHLPLSAITTNLVPSSACGRAVGLSTPGAMDSAGNFGTGGTYDGIVTVNSSFTYAFTRAGLAPGIYDAQRSIEHEIDEVLGLGSKSNTSIVGYRPQDLFMYKAAATLSVVYTDVRYFSIDNGTTNIVGFNSSPSGGDSGDWFSGPCPQTSPFVQNAFSCDNQFSDVTASSPEAINLDVVGYDLVTAITAEDFNGDNKSDIVLQNSTTGDVAEWQMNGATITSGAIVSSPGTSWVVVATGDFNADGKADIVLQNSGTGAVAVWLMNGATVTSGAIAGSPGTAFKVVATGDFNADGKSDIVLQNSTTGDVAVWLMNGTAVSSGAVAGAPGTAYKVIATGDFNGDSKSDIVLQNSTTGDVAAWLMNGTAISSGAVVASPGSAFKVISSGDLNGDGKADLVLQNSLTGDVAGWLMNGTTVSSGAIVGAPGTSFAVLGTADYNGDGKADILLRQTSTGNVAQWLMNATSITSGAVVGAPGTAWKPVVR